MLAHLKMLFNQVGSEEHLSYYSVFDGHAGTDAACYAASHLHELLVASQHYPEDPVQVSVLTSNTTLIMFHCWKHCVLNSIQNTDYHIRHSQTPSSHATKTSQQVARKVAQRQSVLSLGTI